MLTSTSLLLRTSLALSSIGVKPSNLAHKCALVVFPMPGGPVINTARNTFMPFFPGFLKSALRLDGLHGPRVREAHAGRRTDGRPVLQPLTEFLHLALVSAYLLHTLWGILGRPQLRGGIHSRSTQTKEASGRRWRRDKTQRARSQHPVPPSSHASPTRGQQL